jgi:hypothetical protein
MSIEDINYLRNNSIKQNYTFLIDSVETEYSDSGIRRFVYPGKVA